MSKPRKAPDITPEQLEHGVAVNANEYNTRVEALRAMHEQGTYNPPSDPQVLAKQASEAMRGAVGAPAMNPARDNTFNLRDRAPDRQAESMAKSKGWDGHAKEETQDESRQESQDAEGDGGVQERQPAFRVQTRPQGAFPQAGHSDRTQSVGSVPKVEVQTLWCEYSFEAATEEEVRAKIPEGAKAVEVFQIWKATALVKAGHS